MIENMIWFLCWLIAFRKINSSSSIDPNTPYSELCTPSSESAWVNNMNCQNSSESVVKEVVTFCSGPCHPEIHVFLDSWRRTD